MRNAVYERARSALVEQLRSLEPPLSQGDIDRECRDLDEAISASGSRPQPCPGAEAASRPAPASRRAPRRARRRRPPPAPPPGTRRVRRPRRKTRTRPSRPFSPNRPCPTRSRPGPRPRVDSRSPVVHSPGRARAVILGSILALVIGAIAIAAWFLRDTPRRSPSRRRFRCRAAPPAEGPKIAERVGGGPPLPQPQAPAQPAQQGQPAPAAAPRADERRSARGAVRRGCREPAAAQGLSGTGRLAPRRGQCGAGAASRRRCAPSSRSPMPAWC